MSDAAATASLATTRLKRYQIAGFDVALVARIAGSSRAIAAVLDRSGNPTMRRFVEVEAHELRRIGAHLAEIKAAIAALPEIRFPWETPSVSHETLAEMTSATNRRRGAPSAPGRGRLHAHFAIPPGDE